MTKSNLSLHLHLDKLLEKCNHFPASTKVSNMVYNFNKLMNILQKKEVFGLVGNQQLIDQTHSLSMRFMPIAQDIVTAGSKAPSLEAYDLLQEEIEQTLSSDMYVFAKQWGLSVKALHFYKLGNYDKAFDFSLECVILNDYLIQQGLFTLLFRAAEQNKNISRVFFRSGQWEKGAQLGKDLLSYLFNGKKGCLYGKIFADKAVWKEIPYVREGYAYECFNALVSLMIHFERRSAKEEKDVFGKMFKGLRFKINTPDRQILAHWIYIKELYYNQNYTRFLSELIQFMQEPTSIQFDILKISILSDAVKLASTPDYPNSVALMDKLNVLLETELKANDFFKRDISATNLVFLENERPNISASRAS
ncbi:hypothetical protein [Pedobacter sp. ISL-64]|uniref:hypothetical protein n=1 Tax=Pedobacter sp. ISL-64 TaxID=2819164 RepID=UPI001BEC1F56|nr:hypothetical protein [Pedobacter sp. ISL-64]MBT2562524.1 hypothetical protein [Pedobacter sp. ISL-64]